MKIFFSSIAIISALCCMVACNKAKKPEVVVEAFYTHFLNREYEKAKTYVSENSMQWFDLMQHFSEEAPDGKKSQITDITCEIPNDTVAICNCIMINGDEKTPQVVKLRKEGKGWKVDLGKEDSDNQDLPVDPYMLEEEEESARLSDSSLTPTETQMEATTSATPSAENAGK
jgi:hypothetical protein